LAFIAVTSDPTSWSTSQLSAAWNTAFGVSPIANDAGSFYFGTGSTSKTRSATFNGTSWVNAAQAVPGDLIVDGTIRSNAFASNVIYSHKIASTDNTGSNFLNTLTNSGFWMDQTTGNARFAGNLYVGENLYVDGLIETGSLKVGTVGTGNIRSNNVTKGWVNNTRGTWSGSAVNNASYWTNNTRSPVLSVSIGVPSDLTYVNGGFIIINFAGQIYSNHQEDLAIEIWRYRSASNSYTRLANYGGWNDGQDGVSNGALHSLGDPPIPQRIQAESSVNIMAWDNPSSIYGTVTYYGVIASVGGYAGRNIQMNDAFLIATEFKR
jgi:hypothetical protein